MHRLAFIILLILFPLTLLANQVVYLTSMRIQPSLTSTRIVFTLTQKTNGKIQYLPNPDRLIIDFANTRKGFNLLHAQLKGSNVNSINSVDTLEGGVRFILSVQAKVRWKIQFLPENQQHLVDVQIDIISPQPPAKKTPATLQKKLTFTPERDILDAITNFAEEVNQQFIAVDKLLQQESQQPMKRKSPVFLVVIDPGHGGKDTGARGKNGIEEKQIVLAISSMLAQKLNQKPHLHAVLTRRADYFVPLRERIKLARKGNADLFVAIHADAYFDDHATGASVYALSKAGATSEAARWLAMQENYAELGNVELNSLKDRSPLLRSVLIDLAQTVSTRESLRLGKKLLDSLDRISTLHHVEVEQAPFVVLKSPDIPSVLIETGFITNPYEAKRLAEPAYQEKLAQALASGIEAYVTENMP